MKSLTCTPGDIPKSTSSLPRGWLDDSRGHVAAARRGFQTVFRRVAHYARERRRNVAALAHERVREIPGVPDERLVTQAERREIDRDGPARREHHVAHAQARPDQLDAQRVTSDVRAEVAELPEQMPEQQARIVRIDELFHPQRRPAGER